MIKGVSNNSDFAQMPHKGTPIRYGQKLPVRNRQQGEGKFRRAAYGLYPSKKFFHQHSITSDFTVVF